MMTPANWLLVIVVGVYLSGAVGVIILARKLRKTRWPFKLEDRLLRSPGEQLRRRIGEMDEQFIGECFGGLMGMLLALGLVGMVGSKFLSLSPQTTGLLSIAAAVAVMLGSLWRVWQLWEKRAKHYLGWFGERVVGEELAPLALQGWHVFHDVPFVNNGAGFNIDHVVIGLGGVFVIETKTRRKGGARPGFKDNVVFFDGRDLVWPWDEDNHGLEQAERNALWLTDWIKKEIAEKVYVSPMLALPGWWLEMKPAKQTRLCRVVNPKWIPGILAKERPVLTPKQVELIALRLEARCRDVEY